MNNLDYSVNYLTLILIFFKLEKKLLTEFFLSIKLRQGAIS